MKIARIRGIATIQDGGHPGRMHEGVPPGGALVPELLAAANRAAGNAWNAPAIEFFGELVLDDGRTFSSRPWRVGYLASRAFHASRGTLLIGGAAVLGPPVLRAGDEVGEVVQGVVAFADAPIRVLAGPDFWDATLVSAAYTMSASGDRTGLRLDGPPLTPPDRLAGAASAPMVRGAIQVPPAGAAIVLGPDHPTTGGYPVVATVIRADLGRLAARPPGATVRFARVTLEEARQALRT